MVAAQRYATLVKSSLVTMSPLTLRPHAAALIRDTVYLDGGDIWWSSGLASGKFGPPLNQGKFIIIPLTR